VLNPDTNSDSLSVKSKGVRLVSASTVITHATKNGRDSSLAAIIISFVFILLREATSVIAASIKMAIEISYEIACAVDR
jgi:acid phosphatase family membrane protein YuiD